MQNQLALRALFVVLFLFVTPSVHAQDKAPAATTERTWRFGLGLGLMLTNPDTKFNDFKLSDTTIGNRTGEAELGFGKAGSIAAEGRLLGTNSWGFIGGLNLENERKFEGGTVSVPGTGLQGTYSGQDVKLQFATAYFNAVYMWERIYLPFGLNINSVKYKSSTATSSTMDVKGGMGGQLGVGYMVTNNFALELYSWVTAGSIKSTSGGTTLDFGTGYFGSLRVFAKYIF